MDIGDRRVLTITEAAQAARVTRRTIYNWIALCRLEVCFTPGGIPRIFADSLFLPAREESIRKRLQPGARRDCLTGTHGH